MPSISPRLLAALLCATWAVPAFSQSDNVAMSHQVAANQLGMLEYCRGRGDVDQAAVDAERESIGRLPPSTANTASAESLGRSGTMSMGGNTTTMSAMASARNVSIASICKQMGDAAVQTATAFRGNGAVGSGMPGMSGMPSGMAMPTMPPGMTMPAMPPGMPAMPGMPVR